MHQLMPAGVLTELVILGCGTSTGVPLIHCDCRVCRSRNPKNHRTRASAWVRTRGKSLLIDTSVDLWHQARREKLDRIDAILYTHPHADHVHGIDELRSYNYVQQAPIPVWANDWTAADLRKKFDYIFKPGPVEGGGVAQLLLNEFSSTAAALDVLGVPVVPLSLKHGSRECIGYRIDSIAYVTDCSYIPPETLERMEALDVLVLDCLRLERHGTHFNLDQALEVVSKLRPKKTYLTHLGHDFDYNQWNRKLPRGVALAYDGLRVKIRAGQTRRIA